MNKYLVLFLIILTIYNCESDDICPESTLTTPRLIVTFYDEENPDERKNISSGMSRRTNPQDAYMAKSPGRALHARISSSER